MIQPLFYFTPFRFPRFLRFLPHSLNNSLNHSQSRITIRCDIDDITIDVSQAIPVGIILNETVTNALKYAFPDDQRGYINILVKHVGDFIEIKISDNGVGLAKDFNPASLNTVGVKLLEGLAAQLEGTFTTGNNQGLTVCLKFPFKVYNT